MPLAEVDPILRTKVDRTSRNGIRKKQCLIAVRQLDQKLPSTHEANRTRPFEAGQDRGQCDRILALRRDHLHLHRVPGSGDNGNRRWVAASRIRVSLVHKGHETH